MKLVAPVKKVQKTVRLETDVWDTIDAIAKENDIAPSAVIRLLILAGLRNES